MPLGISSSETCSIHSGPSYFAELTIGETSYASISSAGRGFNTKRALAKDVRETSSHCSSSSGCKITGIRLCMGSISSLGSVVMIVKLSTFAPVRFAPHVPQSRKGEGLLTLEMQPHRDLAFSFLPPLIETVRGNNTPASIDERLEGRQLCQCLGSTKQRAKS